MDRKREEIRKLEELWERERSQERRKKVTVVREDLLKKQNERTMIALAD